MNECYDLELQQEINFLYEELAYMQREIEAARKSGNADDYTRFMRVCLPVQKQYLKPCAEQDKRTGSFRDELAAFNGAA